MFAIVVDVPAMSTRYVRSALPEAPVVEDEGRHRLAVRAEGR